MTCLLWLQRVLLRFEQFDVQFDDHCSRDNVTVIDDVTGETLRTTCGNNIPGDVLSSSNRMTIVFKIDKHTSISRGFRMKYTARKMIPGRYITKAVFG